MAGDRLARAAARRVMPPATAMWLSLIRIASSRPKRWLKPPPQRTAYFSKRAQAGRRLARAADARAWCARSACTNAAVAVAMPERWPRKLSAARSADSSARASPSIGHQRGPGRDRVAVALVRRDRHGRIELAQCRLDQRQSRRSSRPCARPRRRAPRVPAGTVAVEVTSPARPRSSASARVTASSISSGERKASGQSRAAHADGSPCAAMRRRAAIARASASVMKVRCACAGSAVREVRAVMPAAALGAPQAPPRRPAARRLPCCAVAACAALSRSMPRDFGERVLQAVARRASTPTCADIRLRSARSRAAHRSATAASFGTDVRHEPRGCAGSAADVLRDARGEDHRFQQRIRGEPVGAVHAGRGDFAGRPQAVERGAAARVGQRRRPCGSARPARPGSGRARDRCRRRGRLA